MSDTPPQLVHSQKILPDRCYVYSEDLAGAIIGPFDTREQAQAHVDFCKARGDGAEHEVVSSFIAARLDWHIIGVYLTPDEDEATPSRKQAVERILKMLNPAPDQLARWRSTVSKYAPATLLSTYNSFLAGTPTTFGYKPAKEVLEV